MSYSTKYGLNKKWWHHKKDTYIFNKEWLAEFKKLDSRLEIPEKFLDGEPNLGKMGIVFWHGDDGHTILPVGVIYNDGKDCLFAYHPEYCADPDTKPIAFTLDKKTPLHIKSNVGNDGIIPFFDNLVSEGWLGYLQQTVVNKIVSPQHAIERSKYYSVDHFKDSNHYNPNERFERLLMFGRGFHGAVSVIDVNASDELLAEEQKLFEGGLEAQATLGGGAPKALAVKTGKSYRIAKRDDTSTHLLKIAEHAHEDLHPLNSMKNEYLNIVATHKLLPHDQTAEGELAMYVKESQPPAIGLFIKRFDRNEKGGRIHFEEALQIKGEVADRMNSQAYTDLLAVGKQLDIPGSGELLFKRVLSQWMLGNADGHFKNFSVWQINGKWKWTPNYDLETTDNAIHNGEKCSGIPLRIGGKKYDIYDISSKELFILAKDLGLTADQAKQSIDEIKANIAPTIDVIKEDANPFITDEDKGLFNSRLKTRCDRMFAGLEIAHQQAKKAESERTFP